MKNFIIEKLIVSGDGKEDAIVEFKDGLNIIRGRSNTGKTWILRCLYFLFGSDEKPFAKITGYTKVTGVFETAMFGRLTISRTLSSAVADVESESRDIEDGKYWTNNQGNNKYKPLHLNELWWKIVGVDEVVRVPKNKFYQREAISWSQAVETFILNEDKVDKSESIIKEDNTSITKLLATLIFIYTGEYKDGIEEIVSDEVFEAVSTNTKRNLDEQIRENEKEIADLNKTIEKLTKEMNDSEIDYSNKIDEAQVYLNELVSDSKALGKQLSRYNKNRLKVTFNIERYKELKSQYMADLERLEVIANGSESMGKIQEEHICQFCGGTFNDIKDDYKDAIKAEVKKLVESIALTQATIDELSVEHEKLSNEIDEISKNRDAVQTAIDSIKIDITNLKEEADKFSKIRSKQELKDFLINRNKELKASRQKEASRKQQENVDPYSARKEFKALFEEPFNKKLSSILKDCNYQSNVSVAWDNTNLDLLIGETSKKDEGKGYRAFFNSITSIMMFEHFNSEQSFVKPSFLAIDTPLLGLDEIEDANDKQTLKYGLYNYLINHQETGQIIVLDNLNIIPDIDFEKHGVNVITYHKQDKPGLTYGFMPSWRKDLNKEQK